MSRPAPRRNQNHHQNNAYPNDLSEHSNHHVGHSHGHGHGQGHGQGQSHARTRSHQLQQQHLHHQQQQQQQQQQPPTSDYESDTPQQHMAQHMAQHVAPSAALAGRTNTELNLSVLRRYLPSITSILSIAANAVVYTFEPPSQWRRTTTEGTMFICSQRKAPGDAGETGCLFILNRKGLQNFILDLDTVGDFELAGDLLIFKLDYAANEVHLESGEAARPLVLGLWTYAEEKSDRETNATLINDMWTQALHSREARAQAAASDPAAVAALAEAGPAAQATGRRLSVSDLFSAYNGHTIPAQTH
ncbi:PH domain-like protein [Xylaria cf. heliscus]|nr:PH domain-like protein [Xylaria cf. heliscus]